MAEAWAYLTSELGCESTWDFGRAHGAGLASWRNPATPDRHARFTMGNPGNCGKCAKSVSPALFRYPNQHVESERSGAMGCLLREDRAPTRSHRCEGVTPCAQIRAGSVSD